MGRTCCLLVSSLPVFRDGYLPVLRSSRAAAAVLHLQQLQRQTPTGATFQLGSPCRCPHFLPLAMEPAAPGGGAGSGTGDTGAGARLRVAESEAATHNNEYR